MRPQRLLFIGPIMPPRGGVSVHINRLIRLLSDEFVISVLDESRHIKADVPNIRRMSPIAYLRAIAHVDVIHVHSFSGALKLVHIACSRILFKRVVLTVHSARTTGIMARLALATSARLAHTVIVVSQKVAESIRGSPHVIPAFIPPFQSELAASAEVARWISERKAEGRFVFVSNAYRLEQLQGEDLYGLDLIIDAFTDSSVADRSACVFLVGAPDYNPGLLNVYKDLVAHRRMEQIFLLRTHPESFAGIAALADGTIRATSSDGDAVSIRESLHLGKLTIASNAAARPDGTRIFKSRDVGDLVATIISSITNEAQNRPAGPSMHDYRDLYRNIYRNRGGSTAA
jgi:hypothetical protein